MTKLREPLSDKQLLAAGRAMCERYENCLVTDIPMGALILMAYFAPGWAWRVP